MTISELKAIKILRHNTNVKPKAIANYHGFFLIFVDDINNKDDQYYIVDVNNNNFTRWTPAYDIDGFIYIIKNKLYKKINLILN